MRMLCLCPTYGRPRRLIENTLACFVAQDYPAAQRRLLMLDDAGLIAPQQGERWEVFSTAQRLPSLPAKYARLLELAGDDWDAVAVWDDDDVYLPWHLAAHAAALATHAWSHPREVWSNYTGEVLREHAAGRFHGSLAIRRELLERIGGWPESRRADFDQVQIATCQELAGDPGRPDAQRPPSYVFRWGSTQAQHAQGLMRSPDDETWYDRSAITDPARIAKLTPRLDPEAQRIVTWANELRQ